MYTGKLRIKRPSKINSLIKDIDRNGCNCQGKPEELTGDLAGYWSVHINKKDRLVFKIENQVLEILQCGSHYKDK